MAVSWVEGIPAEGVTIEALVAGIARSVVKGPLEIISSISSVK